MMFTERFVLLCAVVNNDFLPTPPTSTSSRPFSDHTPGDLSRLRCHPFFVDFRLSSIDTVNLPSSSQHKPLYDMSIALPLPHARTRPSSTSDRPSVS